MPDTILVVDDNENATRMTARMLSVLGYEVMTALHGPNGYAQRAARHPACMPAESERVYLQPLSLAGIVITTLPALTSCMR